jgi:hypothetical protein
MRERLAFVFFLLAVAFTLWRLGWGSLPVAFVTAAISVGAALLGFWIADKMMGQQRK